MNYQNYEFADGELEKARSNLSKWDEISLIDKSLLEKYDNLACRLEEGTKIVFTDPPGIGKSISFCNSFRTKKRHTESAPPDTPHMM